MRVLLLSAAVTVMASVAVWGNPTDSALISAAKRSDLAGVTAALRSAAGVDETASDGSTPLYFAVANENDAIVDVLLRAGAKPTLANRYGYTPVTAAAMTGNASILGRLLRAGADPNVAVPGGETALMTAARTGRVAAVRALIEANAKVDAADEAGQTALMWAASRGNLDVVQALIAAGADIRLSTTGGFNAFFFAVRAARMDVVNAFLEAGADVNGKLTTGESVLDVAIANAHFELASVLLDHGADPNRGGNGWTELHRLALMRRMDVGVFQGPEPTGTMDSIDLARKLIAKGVRVNQRMTTDALRDGQQNRLNRLGATAFLLAARTADLELMKVLLAAGADPKIATADGTTPLHVAAGVMLPNPGQTGGSLPGQEDQVLEAVKLCLELGNDINAKTLDDETPLHGAAYRGINALVQYLVDHGADLSARDIRGFTPLTVANGLAYSDVYHEMRSTAELLQKLMIARGLSIEGQKAPIGTCLNCAAVEGTQSRAAQADRQKRLEERIRREGPVQ